MDGLVLSDHSPMPSLKEYAKVIQPVSVRLVNNGSSITVVNHYDFSDLSHLHVSWHAVTDGLKTETRPLDLPRVPTGENRTVALPLGLNITQSEEWVTVEFKLKKATVWAPKGHIIAWDQLHIQRPSSEMRGLSLVRRQANSEFEKSGTKPFNFTFDFNIV
ncbi:hypothetical protein FGADI_11107 [Fusarium gaditjirri]|uniref:beta-galactosidase n=1 Tax=Fusarium gaditjirri TaxID=282569 RepID=A0A8H4SVT2_9HYPO|nr:hypothetical protein FGADI_11107 [Fusarium gaditjirri]